MECTGKQFGKISNNEFFNYIDKVFKSTFIGVILEESKYENQPNNNFYIRYKYNDIFIAFIKDRSYLEVEIFKDNKYVMLHELFDQFIDIKLSIDNVDAVISFLSYNKEEIFSVA